MRTYKVLSALLTYPDAELIAAGGELRAALAAEDRLPPACRAAVDSLIQRLETVDPLTLQEEYVALFDRGRSTSLHLFEHVHGESRDRGQAMVNLVEAYHSRGLDLAARELPDYLPLFLEFLSLLSTEEARETLAETTHILAALAGRLRQRASPYAAVFESLVHLAGDGDTVARQAAFEIAPGVTADDPAALDAAWAEEPVTFAPGDGATAGCNSGCGKWANIDFITAPARQET